MVKNLDMMKIDLKFQGDVLVADCSPGGGASIDWPPFGFKDGSTVYVNGEPFIYRRKGDEQATYESVKPSE